MDNIFEGAKFGDKFVTRDGKIAIYQHDYIEDIDDEKLNTYKIGHMLFTDDLQFMCSSDGNTIFDSDEYDIVSRYKEHIDEEKLDELADKLNPNNPRGDNFYEVGQYFGFQDGFEAGYRKAMEE